MCVYIHILYVNSGKYPEKVFISKNAAPKQIHSYMHSEHLRFQHGRVTCTYISSKQTYIYIHTCMCIHTGTAKKQQLNFEPSAC